jgi:hypothetical protein
MNQDVKRHEVEILNDSVKCDITLNTEKDKYENKTKKKGAPAKPAPK